MANFMYTNYKRLILGDGTHTRPDWDTDTIKAGIVSGSDYTESAAHQDWDDVGTYTLDACYNGEATQTVANASITATAECDCDDYTFTGVAIDAAKDVDGIVYYRSSGVITTDTLINFQDGFTAVTPNGGDINVTVHASGVFGLSG